ncbi:MAG TPA: proteasome accessory factor PafA2 family protein, partial [Candidatus Saccharimonadales bacterium]
MEGREVTSEGFFTGAPPRIIGTEAEYAVVIDGSRVPSKLTSFRYIGRSGLADELGVFPPLSHMNPLNANVWLGGGGGRVCIDLDHLEHCSPEMLGPLLAAAANFAGIAVVSRLCEAYRELHPKANIRAYRRAGDTIGQNTETNGFHDNFLIPGRLVKDDGPLLRALLSTYLGTRSWAWAGTVGPEGFELSQKAAGIGSIATTAQTTPARTAKRAKPMAWIKTHESDYDILADEDWARAETRYAEAGFSRFSRYLALATNSLTFRLLEHKRIFRQGMLENLILHDPIQATHRISQDLTLRQSFRLRNGQDATAIGIQEGLAIAALKLADEIQLPDDELKAGHLWIDICDRMRRSNPAKGEVLPIINFVDFAGKLWYVRRHVPEIHTIHSHNYEALFRSLIWDQFFPEGPGVLFWRSRNQRDDASDPIG